MVRGTKNISSTSPGKGLRFLNESIKPTTGVTRYPDGSAILPRQPKTVTRSLLKAISSWASLKAVSIALMSVASVVPPGRLTWPACDLRFCDRSVRIMLLVKFTFSREAAISTAAFLSASFLL